MRISHHSRRAAGLLMALAGLALAASPAAAGAATPDPERNATTPTGWHWYFGVSEARVNELAAKDGDRIVDVEVQSTSPYRFSVATVRNQGVYARGWYWYYGLTAAQVNAKLKEKKGRLIDLETYTIGGGARRYAVVMVVNTGQAAKNWHWYFGQSAAQLSSRLKQFKSRLIDLESYSEGGSTKYAAVMIRNSGVDKSGWWYWRNVPLATVQASAKNNGARTFSLDRLPNGRYNAIQIKRKGEFSAYEINVPAARVAAFVSQNAGRIVDLDTYVAGGQQRFTAIINDNADPFNGRVRDLARAAPKLPPARFGFFVKQVGGPVSVSLGADTVFEPASVMKIFHHLYLHTRLEADPAEDLNAIVQLNDCPAGSTAGECAKGPTNVCPTGTGVTATSTMTLDAADRSMMAVSDNRTTQTIELRYGRAALNLFAPSIGAMSTRINDTLGCWGTDNAITLNDLALMIEGATNGTILTTEAVRNRFFDTMIQGNSAAGLQPLVTAEAGTAGKPAIVAEFMANTVYRSKGGSYDKGTQSARAEFGRILLPFKVGGEVEQRPFSFGNFYNCADCRNDTTVGGPYGNAAVEKFRAAIRAAVATW